MTAHSTVQQVAACGRSETAPTALSRRSAHHLSHNLIEVKACGFLPGRKFFEARDPLRRKGLGRDEQKRVIGHPFVVEDGFVSSFKWIGAKIVDLRNPQAGELPAP